VVSGLVWEEVQEDIIRNEEIGMRNVRRIIMNLERDIKNFKLEIFEVGILLFPLNLF
jgi:hypothetical protein